MLLNPTPDQTLLQATTAGFLTDLVPPDVLRELRGDPTGQPAGYWQRGAELGWISLLVDERHGGGAVGDHGLIDLTLIAHEFGKRAAPGPLGPTNVVAALLSRYDAMVDELAELMAGTMTAAWCLGEPAPCDRLDAWSFDIRVEGDDVVLNGIKRPVEGGVQADLLLVTGRTGDGFTNVVVPRSAAGISVRPLLSVETSRRYALVEFDNVRVPRSSVLGPVGGADADVSWSIDTALVIANSESVGAMQAAFDMTVEWAFDRYSFGRPLASYQALKHRFADMKSWLEASHAIADAAAKAVAVGSADASELVSAATAYIGQYGAELVQDCIQIHGGIGMTFEHDVHFFLRRVVANRTAYGSPAEHRQRLATVMARFDEVNA